MTRANLLEQVRSDLERDLGRNGAKYLHQVELYGGEFVAAEMDRHSTAAPACLITCLGWSKPRQSRVPDARAIKWVFFVVTKTPDRKQRMLQAVAIAERLTGWLQDWACVEPVLNGCVGDFYDIVAENLYGRVADAKGLGLWVVRATLDVSNAALRAPLAAHDGDLTQYMSTLLAPTLVLQSDAQTDLPKSSATTEPMVLEQDLNLTRNDIGVDDE